MRVVVNQLEALKRRTGIGHYTSQLLRCLAGQTGEIDVFPQGWLGRAWTMGLRCFPRGQAAPTPGSQASSLVDRVRRQSLKLLRGAGRSLIGLRFRAYCRQNQFDLYHEPNFIPLPCDLPTVATVHDLSILVHPQWHPADRVAFFEKHFQRGLDCCRHFLAISEFGRQEIIRTLHISPERVTRTYMGIRPGLGPLPPEETAGVLAELGLPANYLLCLGTIEPRKNILMLLKAYCSLPELIRSRWPLLLVGGWGWNTGPVADYLRGEARHRGAIHLGYVEEHQVAALYNGARALLYPSLYEGFGMPPIEMMACGGAVLASTAGALVETVGSRAHLIDPHDIDGWRDGMARVVTDDDWWRSLRAGVERLAQRYTWERCAADTLKVYRSLCGVRTDESQTGQRAA